VFYDEVKSPTTYFLATPLVKKKRSKNQSTSEMAAKGDGGEKGDKTSPFNEANIIFLQSMDKLSDELR
jgi:hypothetical protein